MTASSFTLPEHLAQVVASWGLRPDASSSRRLSPSHNLTFVCRRGRRRVFVKASEGPRDASVDFEARLLPLLHAALAHVPDAPVVPQVFATAPGVVALEFLDGRTLFELRRSGEDDEGAVARALGVLHRATTQEAFLPLEPPRGALFERLVWTSPADFAALSPAELALWRAAQADEQALDALAVLATTDTMPGACFVHGDLRQPNVMLGKGRVALIDWERAGHGEAARDVGMFLAEEVGAFLAPATGAARLSQRALAQHLAGQMEAYLGARGGGLDEAFLHRTTLWVAESLLRRAHTVTFVGRSFDATAAHLVGGALDILRAPERWADAFLPARVLGGPALRRAWPRRRPAHPGASASAP